MKVPLSPKSTPHDDRPLPFVMRVAAEWQNFEEGDSVLLFQGRAPLTGDLSVTADGSDVQFSDIGLEV